MKGAGEGAVVHSGLEAPLCPSSGAVWTGGGDSQVIKVTDLKVMSLVVSTGLEI